MEREEREVCFDKHLEIEAYRFKGLLQKFPNHFHEYYVIGFIEAGRRHLICKNREYTVGAGDILLFNPMDNHSCEPIDREAMDYRSINIKTEIMKKTVKEITGEEFLPVFAQPVGFRSELTPLLRELHMAIMEEQPDIRKEEIFLLFLEQLLEEYTAENLPVKTDRINDEILEACKYIDQHYTERVSLDELSRLSNMNKYSLLRSFARSVGITPYRYLETVRINEAKKLLETGVQPIDAAIRTGFADQSHFTNYFKEYIGLTPRQYRNIFADRKNKDYVREGAYETK